MGCDWGLCPAHRLLLLGFNSRTPCGVRPQQPWQHTPTAQVSIHAPRVGCDADRSSVFMISLVFQFTHPVWGATRRPRYVLNRSNRFQFTHPVRGATQKSASPLSWLSVSIHAPRAGCDNYLILTTMTAKGFNSRTPCGVRHVVLTDLGSAEVVSIHAPRAGCDN